MGCSVYCLTPTREDTDRVVGRARQAGIPAGDIRVIVRRQAAEPRHEERSAPVGWWSVPLAPAALWWLALYAWPGVVSRRPPGDERRDPEVITLEKYRAGRGGAR